MKKLFLISLCIIISNMIDAQTSVQIGDLHYYLSGSSASVAPYHVRNPTNYSYYQGYTNDTYIIPENVSYNSLTYTVNAIGNSAFGGTSSITNGSSLSSIYIPLTVKTIGSSAFKRCHHLKKIDLGGAEIIQDGAFVECDALTSIVIPSSVHSLGSVFSGCNLLREIIYLPTTPPSNWTATSMTYVPDKKSYSSPKYRMNDAHIIEMITFDKTELEYTGQSPITTWTNNIEGYTASLSMSSLSGEVGSHEEWIPVTFTKDGESFTANVVYRYTVTPATLTVKTSNVSREYGDDNPSFTLSYSGFVNGENESVLSTMPTVSTTATKSSDVGDYPISISGGSAKNYTLVYEPGTLTITKAPLTAKVDDTSKQYGTGNPAFTVSYSGLKNGETVPKWSEALKIETSATSQSDVGTYAITATGKPVNYNLPVIEAGKLTVTPAPLKIKANDASRLYYEPNPEFSCSYTGFVNNEDKQVITTPPVFNTDALQTSNVGYYEIKPSGAQAKNYDISYESGTLTINKLSLTARANSLSKEYGEENPTLTISYEGFVSDEDESVLTESPIIFTSATKYDDVGTYDITLSGGSSTNYNLTLQSGVLTITKAPLAVIANDATREYGDNNPAFTLRYEGLKLGETEPKMERQISVVTTASIASPVGEYSITASDGVATNYEISYNAGKLNITPAALTVTAFSKFRKYGEDNPEFDYSTTSTKLSSDKFTTIPTLTCPATKSSPVGTYDITVSGAVMPNYEISYVGGILTIDKSKLEISAKNCSRFYGEDNPAFEVVYNGFANNETETNLSVMPTITCRATKESSTGQYPILVSGAKADNYEIAYKDGMLTIDPCKLVIATKNYTRRYGEENPVFEITYEGFVNGENESNLLKKPDIKCVANAKTDVGEYPITLSGAESDNYSFEYNNGTLTIIIAEQEIIWEQAFEKIEVGDQIELLATATSGLPIDYTLSDNTLASLYSANGKAYLDCMQEGTLVVRAIQEGNKNYYAAVRKSKTIQIGNPSGIKTISIGSLSSDAPVYDLMGNKVNVLIKGRIYIQNRKKFIAK